MAEIYRAVNDQFNRYRGHVMRNIAGQENNNMPGVEPVVFTSKERQKEALEYLGRNIFDAPEWLYPQNIIYKIGVNPTNSQNSMQEMVVNQLLSLSTLNSLCNQGYYPVDEYLTDLFAQVWKPIDEGNDWKAKERRNLQRSYISQINNLLNPTTTSGSMRIDNSDVLLYMLQHLDQIEQHLKGLSASGINAQHRDELLRRIKQMRDKHYSPDAKN